MMSRKVKAGAKTSAIIICPQQGKQELFLRSPADICIYGGAAGGGKTFAILLECLRHIDNPRFEAVVFRQSKPQIMNAGGLYDTSKEIYPYFGATSIITPNIQWRFQSGAKITFAHMFYEKEKYNWQGSQIPLLVFDELTHFTESQFFYLFSRNRSTCGVKPYIRATCNPDGESWVARFIEWWLDPNTGYADESKCGKIRYFIRRNDFIHWASTRGELYEKFQLFTPEEQEDVKSVSFISAKLSDNRILVKHNPEYMGTLKAMSEFDREQLLNGNWKIRQISGTLFKTSMFRRFKIGGNCYSVDGKVYEKSACRIFQTCDVAGSLKSSADYFVLGTFAICPDGELLVLEIFRERLEGPDQPGLIARKYLEFMPLMTGVESSGIGLTLYQQLRRMGLPIIDLKPEADKFSRAIPAAARYEAGMIYHLENAHWLNDLEAELLAFPNGTHDDQVDVISYAVFMQSWGYLKEKQRGGRALVLG